MNNQERAKAAIEWAEAEASNYSDQNPIHEYVKLLRPVAKGESVIVSKGKTALDEFKNHISRAIEAADDLPENIRKQFRIVGDLTDLDFEVSRAMIVASQEQEGK
jgi:hypothetical protein